MSEHPPSAVFERMTCERWAYALALKSGHIMAIRQILTYSKVDGEPWLEVELMQAPDPGVEGMIFAPSTRTTASVRLSDVVAAFELWDDDETAEGTADG